MEAGRPSAPMNPRKTTNGKHAAPLALVTGAAGIIGPAIVAHLREKGWRVAATDLDENCFQLYERVAGGPLEAEAIFPADLSKPNACRELVGSVEESQGPLTAIVNNAAINIPAALDTLHESQFRQAFAVNFEAPIYLVQAALPSLIENSGGIVNISSVLVSELRKANTLYACSKAALEKATEIMSLELTELGVRANSIRIGRVPGYALMREKLAGLSPDAAKKLAHELLPKRLEVMRQLLGDHAIGSPADVARTVSFLLSEDSRFINGQTIVLDGGYRHNESLSDQCRDTTAKLVSDWLQANGSSTQSLLCK